MTAALAPLPAELDRAALVPSPDVASLEALPINELDAALGVAWQSFGRRTVVDSWHLGRALHRVREQPRRQFAPYCERIGMTRSWAYLLLNLADGPLAEVSCHRTVDGAVKALKARKALPPAAEPAEPATPAPAVEAVPVEPDPDPEAVVAEVVEEVLPARDREAELERLCIRIQDEDGEAIDILSRKLDATDERHRDDVAAVNTSNREKNAAKRGKRDVGEAILAAPACACGSGAVHVEDLLVEFYGWARKATP